MSAMIGILLDVSGSMRKTIRRPVNQEGGSWARSVFRVVDEWVKHDVSTDNRVFAIAFGANKEPAVFDLLNTVERASTYTGKWNPLDRNQVLEKILTTLERGGAPHVRLWTSVDVLRSSISEEESRLFLSVLDADSHFQREFVTKCLPEQCRASRRQGELGVDVLDVEERLPEQCRASRRQRLLCLNVLNVGMKVLRAVPYAGYAIADMATANSVRDVVRKGLNLMWQTIAVQVSLGVIMNVQNASKLLHGCVEEDSLTARQVDGLMKGVEPFIYGHAPMVSALGKARFQMFLPEYGHKKKVLFVLSAGLPSDLESGDQSLLSASGEHVVCCYISDSDISDPKHLYCAPRKEWDEGAQFMFALSTPLRVQDLPRTIFVKQGWKVDYKTNEIRLFLQVNHPDMIDEVCRFAKDVVCSQDSLSDALVSIDFDRYIRRTNDEFKPEVQKDETCYAHASATVLHLAMKRIFEREDGYPDFLKLLQELIDMYGASGADTLTVLQQICPKYRLRCKPVTPIDALEAISAKRPVLARFWVTQQEWDVFNNFYIVEDNAKRVLTRDVLDIRKRPAGTKSGDLLGHAVVLTSFSNDRLTLMNSNSRGSEWANNGFFSVRDASVLGLQFIDVKWEDCDLTPSEKEAYKREGPRIAGELMRNLTGLRTATYTCPLCFKKSAVSDFSGQLVRATCPKCNDTFSTTREDSHDLVLNMYLTSMCC